MAWLTTFSLLLVTTLYLTSAEDPEALEVQYKQATYTASTRSSVKLICQVLYDPVRCGQVHGEWSQLGHDHKLIDPEKYFTKVNETIIDNNKRRRQIVTEILDLCSKDEGTYQCQAECTKGQTAMGHLIIVNVKN